MIGVVLGYQRLSTVSSCLQDCFRTVLITGVRVSELVVHVELSLVGLG